MTAALSVWADDQGMVALQLQTERLDSGVVRISLRFHGLTYRPVYLPET